MDESSAEFPLDAVIAACEVVFEFFHEEATKLWKSSSRIREEFADYESEIGYSAAMSLEKGPSKLYQLCLAAKASGETKVRVSAADFWSIMSAYKPN